MLKLHYTMYLGLTVKDTKVLLQHSISLADELPGIYMMAYK